MSICAKYGRLEESNTFVRLHSKRQGLKFLEVELHSQAKAKWDTMEVVLFKLSSD